MENILIGGFAAVGAGFFSNPLDVAKVRMQLQGELRSQGLYNMRYRNAIHAIYVVAKYDGICALQAGLRPALMFQFVCNGIRLGTYQYVSARGYTKDEAGNLAIYKVIPVSGLCGVLGATAGSPFFLIKTHLQAKAAKEIAFGHQHEHEGTFSALRNIYKTQGIRGIFRGTTSAIPRAVVGSASQLTAFDFFKRWFSTVSFVNHSPFYVSTVSSFFSGIIVGVCMAPFDLVSTRLYNQGVVNGKGVLYSGYFNCIKKIFISEGVLGFFKGFGPSYMRLGPHSMLNLIFWDFLKGAYKEGYRF